MNSARSPRGAPWRALASTLGERADMLAAARPRVQRAAMTAERQFNDGEVVPGTRYRVLGLIGSGGMGSVYEVEHVELGKRFVLKALLRGLANRDDLVRRLRNEWRALGQLEHVNIVSVTDAGVTTTGIPYFVMERLHGETLATRLRRLRRLRVAEALTIAADVLEGLNAAHSLGIVHRDVKPPNIFLVAQRPAKLLDFGIAKMLDPKASQITGRGMAVGTPRYMSPEQSTGGAVDARTDLYSTGIILFEMIVGAGPFDHAKDGNELFLAQLTQEAPPVSRFVPVPKELDQVVARLLAKKPGERPEDAARVAKELRALAVQLKDLPGPTPPPGVAHPGVAAARITEDGDATTRVVEPGTQTGTPVFSVGGTLLGFAEPGTGTSDARPHPTATVPLDALEPIAPPVGLEPHTEDGVVTHTAAPRLEVSAPAVAPPTVEPEATAPTPSVRPSPAPTRGKGRALAAAAAIGACGLAASVALLSRRAPVSAPVQASEPEPATREVPPAPPAVPAPPAASVTTPTPGVSVEPPPSSPPAPAATEELRPVAVPTLSAPPSAPAPSAKYSSISTGSALHSVRPSPSAPRPVTSPRPPPRAALPKLPGSGL